MKISGPQTSEQRVLELLYEMITRGDFPSGEFLSQRRLAQLTNSSVISVRGALRQLENEGLIENVPRWGVRIPVLTEETLRDRYAIRELLELEVISRIHGELNDDQIRYIMDMAKELELMILQMKSGDLSPFAMLHKQFHIYLAECTGSTYLVRMLRSVLNASLMIMNARSTWSYPRKEKGIPSHTDLTLALSEKPLDYVLDIMKRHIAGGLESELDALDDYSSRMGNKPGRGVYYPNV